MQYLDTKVKGLIIPNDIANMILELPKEDIAEVITRSIYHYFGQPLPQHENQEHNLSTTALVILKIFLPIIDKNVSKYIAVCEKNKDNRQKGWNKTKEKGEGNQDKYGDFIKECNDGNNIT